MKKAFTLIELLVVIAIIAILAAILFPVFAQAKAAAKATGDLSGLKEIGLAAQMYNSDYDDSYAPAYDRSYGEWDSPSGKMPVLRRWSSEAIMQPYIKSSAIFRSPAFDDTTSDLSGLPAASYGIDPAKIKPNSYQANTMTVDPVTIMKIDLTGGTPSLQGGLFIDRTGLRSGFSTEVKTSTMVAYPSELIAFTTGANVANMAYLRRSYSNTEAAIWYEDFLESYVLEVEIRDGIFGKLSGGSNYVFADSHAKKLPSGQLLGPNGKLNQHRWIVAPGN